MREINPGTNRAYFGDTDTAALLLGQARVQMGIMKQFMALNELQVLARTVHLPDGTVFSLSSMFGVDAIRIFVPEKKPVEAGEEVAVPRELPENWGWIFFEIEGTPEKEFICLATRDENKDLEKQFTITRRIESGALRDESDIIDGTFWEMEVADRNEGEEVLVLSGTEDGNDDLLLAWVSKINRGGYIRLLGFDAAGFANAVSLSVNGRFAVLHMIFNDSGSKLMVFTIEEKEGVSVPVITRRDLPAPAQSTGFEADIAYARDQSAAFWMVENNIPSGISTEFGGPTVLTQNWLLYRQEIASGALVPFADITMSPPQESFGYIVENGQGGTWVVLASSTWQEDIWMKPTPPSGDPVPTPFATRVGAAFRIYNNDTLVHSLSFPFPSRLDPFTESFSSFDFLTRENVFAEVSEDGRTFACGYLNPHSEHTGQVVNNQMHLVAIRDGVVFVLDFSSDTWYGRTQLLVFGTKVFYSGKDAAGAVLLSFEKGGWTQLPLSDTSARFDFEIFYQLLSESSDTDLRWYGVQKGAVRFHQIVRNESGVWVHTDDGPPRYPSIKNSDETVVVEALETTHQWGQDNTEET